MTDPSKSEDRWWDYGKWQRRRVAQARNFSAARQVEDNGGDFDWVEGRIRADASIAGLVISFRHWRQLDSMTTTTDFGRFREGENSSEVGRRGCLRWRIWCDNVEQRGLFWERWARNSTTPKVMHWTVVSPVVRCRRCGRLSLGWSSTWLKWLCGGVWAEDSPLRVRLSSVSFFCRNCFSFFFSFCPSPLSFFFLFLFPALWCCSFIQRRWWSWSVRRGCL